MLVAVDVRSGMGGDWLYFARQPLATYTISYITKLPPDFVFFIIIIELPLWIESPP